MKRFHVHVSVDDLERSIRFYSTLFGADPAVTKPDYAKWMLEDPRVNFAVSTGRNRVGIDHLGLQTDSDEELEALNAQLQQAHVQTAAEHNVACCYARSNKYWVKDPAGVPWETFYSLASAPVHREADAQGHEQQACDESNATVQAVRDGRRTRSSGVISAHGDRSACCQR